MHCDCFRVSTRAVNIYAPHGTAARCDIGPVRAPGNSCLPQGSLRPQGSSINYQSLNNNYRTIMKRLAPVLIVTATLLGALPLLAQQKKAASTGGVSPHETTSAVIDGCRVTVTYGRPFTKSPKTGEMRKIWGGLVPYDKAWRMGSDEATLLVTQKPLVFGETTVPAGAYTLYMVPSENGTSKLAISKSIGQWGVPVNEKNDLARVDLTKESMNKTMDQFTMAVAKNPSGGGELKLMWEDTQFLAPFTVQK